MTHARQPRKLHEGALFWPKTMSDAPSYPALQGRLTTEVAIVGGGLTGAICAAVMAGAGIPAVLIEGRYVASGSTAANTGLIQFASDIMLSELMDRVGEVDAVRFYQASRKALVGLAQLSADTGEDTGFYSRSSLYCASSEDDVSKLIREYSLLRKYDFPVTWGFPARVGGRIAERMAAGMATHGDAEINPVRLTHALLAYAAKRGVKIYENTAVLELGRLNGKHTLLCQDGEITASCVVKATGYLPGIVTPAASSAPVLKRTFALATAPGQVPDEWPDQYMMWETARPYFYFRTTPDGRIIAGGADECASETPCDDNSLEHRTEGLLADLADLFPGRTFTAEDAWCGLFGESSDDLPVLGEDPELPGIFHALGVGGNGTTYAMLAALMLRDRMQGREHPLARLLTPARALHAVHPANVPFWQTGHTGSTASMFA